MSWSCPSETIVDSSGSITDYRAKFTNKYVSGTSGPKERSCLPNNGDGFSLSQMNSKGVVFASPLSSQVTTILGIWQATPISVSDLSSRDTQVNNPNVIIESRDLNPASTFSTKAKELRDSIQREYCFYYNRYVYGLSSLLTDAANSAIDKTGTAYTTKKTNVILLNSKLNQILQILHALTSSRRTTLNTYYGTNTGVNTLNTNIGTLSTSLTNHSKALKDKSLELNVQSAMIDYSLEKNASSRNLLGIYGFMNIVAIGLLFYLYRSSKA